MYSFIMTDWKKRPYLFELGGCERRIDNVTLTLPTTFAGEEQADSGILVIERKCELLDERNKSKI